MDANVEERTTKLSLAIFPIDDYTKKQLTGEINISIKDRKHKAVMNPSGYYIFLDLPNDTCTVQMRSDFYFDEDVEVTLSSLDPLNPVKEVNLKPNPTYPFPPGTTLIRGIVQNSNETAVPNANVKVSGKDIETRTSEKGEFVLYFRPLKEDEIIKEDGKRFVEVNGSKTIHLEVSHPTGLSGEAYLQAEEGKATTIKYIKAT